MKLAKNVEMLELKNEGGTLYPVLLWDEKEVVLIDTGLPGGLEALREAVLKTGFALEDITRVFLTHQDLDHVGSAKALASMGAEILAHELEAPYIAGEKTSVRLTDMESRLNEMGDDERAFYEQAKQGAPFFYVKVDTPLKDNDMFDFCGGIKVIHTPGHMPGHMALLFMKDNIIMAGDGANIKDGGLVGADPNFTKDMAEAEVSFTKVKALNPRIIVTYHGGAFDCAEGKVR